MSPVRIIILGILLYLLFRLVFGKKISFPNKKSGREESLRQPLQDVLVEDPVCHTFIPRGQAEVLLLEGEKHYFCSDECRKKFIKNKGAKQ